jgi:hypothetical protein
MSLLFVLGLWLFLGGSIYRARTRSRSAPGDRAPGDGHVALGHRRVHAEIPETVPSEWIEAYRAENGG